MRRSFIPALGLVALLAACQQGSDLERAAVGAAIGCAAGEILSDGECITGAAVGGAAGALANDF
ncbi:hypothetical protein [Jannaschia aquimarina]|uniref:YMGG-like Gly-zipper domain-containing protein n=1 Tax=Jannaschia aquimarina TaxID=935700 RepID=A0A0D1D804_9RHOB|nr:hypothetical protein [Jannaschia aquimarina]KIT16083.1 hypothetical protein jaqu_23550 [Jannaschia aquimarina]SNT01963.1 hypothetical protein SAMN05421775_104266 [Jannaschia aquimarina]